ncbi:hypothetical protein BHE74_00053165 [Ensete ventricosum]|nr:hypothetical protein BHE74_00053165 [Ensete ventricosum]
MVEEMDLVHLVKENQAEDVLCSEMEIDENDVLSCTNDRRNVGSEKGEGSTVVFSREAPLLTKDGLISKDCSCGSKKVRSRASVLMEVSEVTSKDKWKQEKKLSRQDRIELGRLFQRVVSSQDSELAENLIQLADPQTLNDMLCIALDSIWFLTTRQELNIITGLIKKIVADGANEFTRAALRTSFLASCVSACQSRTMSLADTVGIMAQRRGRGGEEGGVGVNLRAVARRGETDEGGGGNSTPGSTRGVGVGVNSRAVARRGRTMDVEKGTAHRGA